MAIIRWDPFAELNALHDQLNSLFSDRLAGQHPLHLAPITDVYREDDTHLMVEVHLPNFTEKEVDISVADGALEIRAEHHEEEKAGKKRDYLVRESSSSFYRRIPLPKQANQDDIKADFEHGVLKVTVPFKELPQPKRVAISAKVKK